MQLNGSLEMVLEQLPAERLKALLLWSCTGEEPVTCQSPALRKAVAELQNAPAEVLFDVLESLEVSELVTFALLNEFGPRFAERPCFLPLAQAAATRLGSRIS